MHHDVIQKPPQPTPIPLPAEGVGRIFAANIVVMQYVQCLPRVRIDTPWEQHSYQGRDFRGRAVMYSILDRKIRMYQVQDVVCRGDPREGDDSSVSF